MGREGKQRRTQYVEWLLKIVKLIANDFIERFNQTKFKLKINLN